MENNTELITLDKRKNIATLISTDEIQEITLSLENELARPEYNFIVTETTVKDAKGVMANLNKIKTMFKDFAKFKVDQESDDLNKFKGSFKEFENMCQAKRDEIEHSVKIFEDEARRKHLLTGAAYLDSKYAEFEIREEFQSFDFKISISAFNADGTKLKKPFIDALDLIIDSAKGKQAQVDLELKEAEIKRNQEIQDAVEADRIKRAEQDEANRVKERERLEQEKQDALEQQRKELEQTPVLDSSIEVPEQVTPIVARTETAVPATEPRTKPTSSMPAKKIVRVEAIFDVEVPDYVPDEAVIDKVYNRLMVAKIDPNQLASLKAIDV